MEKAKPDLMSGSGTHRPADSKRILAQLEHGARPAGPARTAGWTIDGWTIGLFALLLLMCCVAWMMHDKTITPKSYRHDYGGAVRRMTPVAQEHLPQAAQAATIINIESPPMAPAADVAAGATVDVAGVTGSAGPAVAAMGAPASGHAAPLPLARALARTGAAQQKPLAPAARATEAAASPAAHAGDTDVALLTALVAHAGTPSAVMPERPRDIVERQDGDSTAQLLARCKQLGLIEGMLCRSRICSGRWENDAACRAPAH